MQILYMANSFSVHVIEIYFLIKNRVYYIPFLIDMHILIYFKKLYVFL